MNTRKEDFKKLKEITLGNEKNDRSFQKMCRHDKKGDFYWRNLSKQKSGPVTSYNLYSGQMPLSYKLN